MKLLLQILSEPEKVKTFSVSDWDVTIRFARYTRLLGHLHFLMAQYSLLNDIPVKVKDILLGGQVYNSYFSMQARREMRHIGKAFAATELPIVLLKGGAYIHAQLGAYGGRRLSDIDLLVAPADLSAVESVFLANGWEYGEVNDYDQHYYRQWMHEVPPMIHSERNMEVDLHHNIVPPVSCIKVDSTKLLSQAVSIENSPFRVLEAKDMLLHSATHLFFNDELRGGLRDLVDMHELCLQFSTKDNFWPQLVGRARELGLQRSLYYALSSLHAYLKTPIPDDVMADIALDRPVFFVDLWMKQLIQRLIFPGNVEKMEAPIAQWLLFVRSHWLRMPLGMLIKHLTYKKIQASKSSH